MKKMILLCFASLAVNAQVGLIRADTGSIVITPQGIRSAENNGSDYSSISLGDEAYILSNSQKNNIAIGWKALSNATGSNNVGIGSVTMPNAGGNDNVALGKYSANWNSSGSRNTALGAEAGFYNQTGSNNTSVGYKAGYYYYGNNFTGNVLIGNEAGGNQPSDNKLFIANTNTNTPLIWGDFSLAHLGLHGKVGIQTKAPLDLLHIHDPSGSIPESYLRFTNGLSGTQIEDGFRLGVTEFLTGIVWQYENRPISFGTNNQQRVLIHENGNVGINTYDPQQKLQVNDGGIRLRNTTDSKSWEWNYDETNNYTYFDEFGVGRKLYLRNGANPLVGIGVNPTYNLHVKSNNSETHLFLENGGGGMLFKAKIDDSYINQSTGRFALRTNDLERITIFQNSARVGINVPANTTSTAYSLDIYDGFSLLSSTVRIRPVAWQANSEAFLAFGDNNHYVKATHSVGMLIHDTNRIKLTGSNVGIGDAEPEAKFQVDGFTKLGSDAPKIKIKKLVINTAGTQGEQVQIDHMLDRSKILSVTVLVDYGTNEFVPHGYNHASGYEFNFNVDNENKIEIKNHPTNSGNILNKPAKIMITYEE